MEASYGFLTPKLKYVYTHYDLDLDSKGKTDLANASQQTRDLRGDFSSSQNRSVPILASIAVCTSTAIPSGLAKTTVKP